MAIVEAAFKASDIPQDVESPNKPAKGHRRNRDWATVIGTIRKLEQQENESRDESLGRIEKLTADMAHWMDRAHTAEREGEQLKLKLKIIEGDFSEKDSKFLLEAATS